LAAKIFEIFYFQSDFFKYLPVNAFLDRFPEFNKSGDKTVDITFKSGIVCQEDLIPLVIAVIAAGLIRG
jgi:hypothetical protein